ncbi:MAG TPA: DinB family protein [Acidimicrobiales bacterium]
MPEPDGLPGELPAERPPVLSVPRPDESVPADEMAMARAWLTYLREASIHKLADLDDEQLRWKPAPTANSLGQIVVHLGYAERLWLRAIFAGEPMDMGWRAHMFDLPDGWSVDDVVAFYRAETAAADAVLDAASSFDLPSSGPIRSTTLRWAVVHLIEETARHAGHLDITRELIDGRTGR